MVISVVLEDGFLGPLFKVEHTFLNEQAIHYAGWWMGIKARCLLLGEDMVMVVVMMLVVMGMVRMFCPDRGFFL